MTSPLETSMKFDWCIEHINLTDFVAQGLSGSIMVRGGPIMEPNNVLQEIRKMRFEGTWNEWKKDG